MGADGVGRAPVDDTVSVASASDEIKFINLGRPRPDMERRTREMGFYHLLIDAKESGGEVSLIGRDVFRTGERRPFVDEIHMSDGDVPADLVRGDG